MAGPFWELDLFNEPIFRLECPGSKLVRTGIAPLGSLFKLMTL